jgi:N-glycosylase/DNA lyase
MDIRWHITNDDMRRIRTLLEQQADDFLVLKRKKRNLAAKKPFTTKYKFWNQMVAARLTSVQRSGPNSHVTKFNKTRPFPLAHKTICARHNRQNFMAAILENFGGIRFPNSIAKHLNANFERLENGEWRTTLRQCNRLTKPVAREVEREVAAYIQTTFDGFGPKQSRNLLQGLGLTRYEIPIDSRVTGWLNDFGFPVRLSANALGDANYYNFISDGIQALCAKCDVYPCVLDAAIFALKDGDGWTDENTVY